MNSLAFLILRITFGLGLAWHGFQNLFLLENGISGLSSLIEAQGWPLPMAMAYLAKLSELLCGLMVAIGLFTRWAALACSFVMGTAIYMTGSLMEFGTWELASLYCAGFLALLFSGAGGVSIDALRAASSRRAALAVAEGLDADFEPEGDQEEEEVSNPKLVMDSLDRAPAPGKLNTDSGPKPPGVPQAE